MLNQRSSDIIIHMGWEPVTVRMNGTNVKAFRPAAQGFCWVEFDSGDEWHPISNPMEEWFLNLINAGTAVGNVYFALDAPGARPNEAQGADSNDVNNMTTGMGN